MCLIISLRKIGNFLLLRVSMYFYLKNMLERKKESLMFLKCCNQEVITERTKKMKDSHRNFMLVCNSINLT